jgi:hypothetical protein
LTRRSEHNRIAPPLHEGHAEISLKLLDLHGQGRLRYGALTGRHAEMLYTGQRLKIS